MAIRIETQLSKKIPIAGEAYSSRQASITISAEVNDLSSIPDQARSLYTLAEQAVDNQLGITPQQPVQPTSPVPATPNRPVATAAAPKPASSPQPYRNQARRAPAPISEAQLRYLGQLIKTTNASVDAILHQHQVGALRDLSSKAASALIEEMRGVTA